MSPTAQLEIRPIHRADREALALAFERLSDESRYRRFLAPKSRLTERELDHLAYVDHVTHEVLVAVGPEGEIAGEARYAPWPGRPGVADFAVTIADEWQGRGLGTQLARQLLDVARHNGITLLTTSALWENEGARRLLRRLGFRPCGSEGAVLDFRLQLAPAAAEAA
jgi:RimJ/RimL family protein N-acetyltransferase